MLSEEERREVEEEMARFPDPRAACIDALKTVQRRRGWISDETLRDLARLLEMTPEELDGVATFYNLIHRRPVGRHVVLLCDSVSCWMLGAERVEWALRKKLGVRPGETSPDGRFTVLPIACLGACDRAPALMVGEDLHAPVDPDRAPDLLEGYP